MMLPLIMYQSMEHYKQKDQIIVLSLIFFIILIFGAIGYALDRFFRKRE